MRKSFVIMICVLTIFITGCSSNNIDDQVNNSAAGDIDMTKIVKKNIDYSYKNKELGFEIEIPKKFGDYGVEITEGYWDGPAKVYKSVRFGMKTSDRNWPTFDYDKAEIFRIMIYKTDDWKDYLSTGLPMPILLETTKEFVYAYYDKVNFPTDISFTKNEIQKILNGFELLSGEVIPTIIPVISNEIPQGDG